VEYINLQTFSILLLHQHLWIP